MKAFPQHYRARNRGKYQVDATFNKPRAFLISLNQCYKIPWLITPEPYEQLLSPIPASSRPAPTSYRGFYSQNMANVDDRNSQFGLACCQWSTKISSLHIEEIPNYECTQTTCRKLLSPGPDDEYLSAIFLADATWSGPEHQTGSLGNIGLPIAMHLLLGVFGWGYT